MNGSAGFSEDGQLDESSGVNVAYCRRWAAGILAQAEAGFVHQGTPSHLDPRRDGDVLLCYTLGYSLAELIARRNLIVNKEQFRRFSSYIERRAQAEPVAYIIGSKEFFGVSFCLNQSVLIPRPETELLVEVAASLLKSASLQRVSLIDVGTGSGAIIVSLLYWLSEQLPGKLPKSIFALDICSSAISLASKNAKLQGITANINWLQTDLLSGLRDDPTIEREIIVANLPYVSASAQLAVDVQKYEPPAALYAGGDGLELISKCIAQAALRKPAVDLLLEFGIGQLSAIRDELTRYGFCCAGVYRDLAGIERVVHAVKVGAPQVRF